MLDFFKCENSRDGQGNVENENCDITRANDCVNIAFVCKGQLISEGNSGIFKSPKNRTKYFEGFLPSPLKLSFSI